MSRSLKAGNRRESPVIFFDIELDDMNLSVYEYRAYGRIVRRASGGMRDCTESLDSMARGCQMSRRTLINAIKGLIERGMVERESKHGETSTYYLTDKSRWVPGAPDAHVTSALYAREVVQEMPTPGARRAQEVVHHLPTKNTSKNTTKKTTEEREAPVRELASVTSSLDAVSILLEVFPQMPIYSQEIIDAAGITNLDLWRTICQDWRDNRYSPRNVTGMRDRYRQQLAKLEESHNGQTGIRSTVNRLSANERAARQTLELMFPGSTTGTQNGLAQLDSENPPSEQLAIMRRR
jgi:DNA-binding transcriptional regulator GbsR (MarR family)